MNEPFFLLDYDIPSDSGLENPSGILRHRALRFTKSNWIIFKSLFPWNAFNDLAAGGAKWGLFEMAPSANVELLRAAKDTLIDELRKAKGRLADSLAALDAKATQAATRKEHIKIGKDRANAVDKLRDLVKQLEQACKTYGIDVTTHLTSARTVATATEQAGYTQAALIADLARQAVGTELEAAAATNEVPVGILADFVEERGGDATAVRGVLAVEAANHEAAITQAELDNVPPPAPPKSTVTTTYLESKGGRWRIEYSINCTKAVVTKSHNKTVVDAMSITVAEARHHYAASLAQGYTKIDF